MTLRAILKSVLWFFAIVQAIVLVCLTLTAYWPEPCWWLANFLQIMPVWILGIPLFLSFLIALCLLDIQLIFFHCFLFIIFVLGVLGYQIHWFGRQIVRAPDVLRIISYNIGEGVRLDALSELIQELQPDIVVLQECEKEQASALNARLEDPHWQWSVLDQLGLFSRLPILNGELKNSDTVKELEGMMARYTLKTSAGLISLLTVHLETPRKGIQKMLLKDQGLADSMRNFTQTQQNESMIASRWAAKRSPLIVAGDFNMSVKNPNYRKYWSYLTNAFSSAGQGLGYTKFTKYFGARIDHILVDHHWQVKQAWVGPSLGGDHRPMIADFILTQSDGTIILVPAETTQGAQSSEINPSLLPSANRAPQHPEAFVFDPFETSLGNFTSSNGAELMLDASSSHSGNRSMQISARSSSEAVSVETSQKDWNMNEYPSVSFAYRIPAGTSVTMSVKTIFGDWICLGKTKEAKCQEAESPSSLLLTDDDQWHEVNMDVRSIVKSVVSAVELLQEWQWRLWPTGQEENSVWFDDFIIR